MPRCKKNARRGRPQRSEKSIAPPWSPRGDTLWTLLGLGALALGAAWFGRRSPSPSRSRPTPPRPENENDPPRAAAEDTDAGALAYEPPLDAEVAWVPGPAGSLRLCERNHHGRRAVLFVHGLGGRLEQWTPLLEALGPGLRGLAVDLPGHGESDPATDDDYSVPRLAAAVNAAAASLDTKLRRPGIEAYRQPRLILVAHSLGAAAVLEVAAQHPERVAGILLVDPSGDETRVDAKQRESFLETLRRDPAREIPWYYRQMLHGSGPEVTARVLESLEATPDDVLLAYLEGAATHSPIDALQRYDGPVISVVSELNNSPQSLHRLHRSLPVRHIYGAGHWLMMERPEEVREALWELLEEIDRRGASGA